MERKLFLFFKLLIILIFFTLIVSCNQSKIHFETLEHKNDTLKNMTSIESINLTHGIIIKRYISGNSNYFDILELNNLRLDSNDKLIMLDTAECNFYIKSNNKLDTICKSYSIFGDYLMITKDLIQVLTIETYNLKSKKKLPSLITEELIVDTTKKELFLIRNRGNIRNYILRLKLMGDKFLRLDSLENTEKNRRIMKLEN